MLHVILLSTLIIIAKSYVTSHEICGDTFLFEPQIEACCNNVKYIKAVAYCCNGIVTEGPCVSSSTPGIQLPSGARLVIRNDYIHAVDAEVDVDDGTDDGGDDGGDDGSDVDDGTDDVGDDDGGDDGGDVDDETDDVESAGETDDDDDDDDNDDTDGVGSSSDDNSSEEVDDTGEEAGSREDGFEGALFDQHGNAVGYTSSANDDMDYYVKITLINMWAILGCIVILNVLFYWCYCRRNNQKFAMDKVQSNSMFVDERIITDDEVDERGTDAV